MVKQTQQKRKERESKKYLLVHNPKLTAPVIAKMNQINTFGKKDLLISFMKVTMKSKMSKDQKTIN